MGDFNRDVIFEYLRGLDVKTVTVRYSGSGDSGAIDDVIFDDDEDKGKDVEVEVEEVSSRFDKKENMFVEMREKVMKSLEEAVADFCYQHLKRLHPGWEINDGGDGEFTFNVADAKINLTHNMNFVSQETSEHEL